MNKKLLLTLTALPLLLGSCVSKTSTGEKIATTKETTDWINVNYFRGNVESNLKKYRKINSEIYELVYEYEATTWTGMPGSTYSYGSFQITNDEGKYISGYTRVTAENYSSKLTWTRYFKEIGMDGYFLNDQPTIVDGSYRYGGPTFTTCAKGYLNRETDDFKKYIFEEDSTNLVNYINNSDNWLDGGGTCKYNRDVTSACYTLTRNIERLTTSVYLYTIDEYERGQYDLSAATTIVDYKYSESYSGFSINTYLGK